MHRTDHSGGGVWMCVPVGLGSPVRTRHRCLDCRLEGPCQGSKIIAALEKHTNARVHAGVAYLSGWQRCEQTFVQETVTGVVELHRGERIAKVSVEPSADEQQIRRVLAQDGADDALYRKFVDVDVSVRREGHVDGEALPVASATVRRSPGTGVAG